MTKTSNINGKYHKDSKADKIFHWSEEMGFDAIGFASLSDGALDEASQDLARFLSHHHHGTMGWMERQARRHPLQLWSKAKTALMLGADYTPKNNPLALNACKEKGAISVYAQGEDYHDVLKTKAGALAQKINGEWGGRAKIFCDTAPLMEKPLARLAGLGWQGKHTNLVSRKLGSWFFLAAILLDIDIKPSPSGQNHCGQCRACLDICPTKAFSAPYQLDARRCISYLTIEHKGHIPIELRRPMGNHIYGCDDCLAICPWNKFAKEARCWKEFQPRVNMQSPSLLELVLQNESQFRQMVQNSPIKRIGFERFMRNVLIALGNSDITLSLEKLDLIFDRLLSHSSPLIRLAAIWALRQKSSKKHVAHKKALHLPKEKDEDVIKEWMREKA